MNTLSIDDYIAQYNDLLSKEHGYQFLMKAQFAIPKISKLNNDELFFGFVTFVMGHLNKLNEPESSIAILDIAFKEFTKSHQVLGDQLFFLKQFMNFYKLVPSQCNKTHFKISFLQYCEKCKIPDDILKQNEVYLLFALDNIKNGNNIIGYRFALKSEDFEAIMSSFEAIRGTIQDKNEMDYFVTRTILELIVLKNLTLAQRIILKYCPSLNSQLDSSPPVLNFGLLLISFLSNDQRTFDKLSKLTNYYQYLIDKEITFKKYLNMISKIYFNKQLISNDLGGFSFFNILKSLTGS